VIILLCADERIDRHLTANNDQKHKHKKHIALNVPKPISGRDIENKFELVQKCISASSSPLGAPVNRSSQTLDRPPQPNDGGKRKSTDTPIKVDTL